MTIKQFQGNRLIAELDDNHLTLPPERYVRDDWRLVKKERGALVCEPNVDGMHADTFDGAKQALEALRSGSGKVEAGGMQVGTYGKDGGPRKRMNLRPNHESDHIKHTGVQYA